jgi:cell wall-associated NlpC family hydrolase
MTRGRPRAAFALVALAVVAGTLGAPTAAADPLGDAQAQAAALQKHIASLQLQAEQASERYDATEAALGALVGEQRAAEQRATAAQAAVTQASAIAGDQARALYTSGGTYVLYAGVLVGADPTNYAIGLHDIAIVTTSGRRALAGLGTATAAARAAQDEVTTLVGRQDDLLAQAAAAAQDVQNSLAEEQQALATTNEQITALEAALQAQLDAESAARAAAELQSARQAAIDAGYTPPPPDPTAQAAIAAARTQLGKPYVYGGSGPDTWDCSGLTQWAFRQAGVSLPRTAAEQYAAVAQKVPLGELEPGDLLFWATDPNDEASIHHVAIYLGDGQMLAAPHTGTDVQIEPVYLDGYFGADRPG